MFRLCKILLLSIFCFTILVFAQTSDQVINITSEIDGRSINSDKLKLEICIGERSITPKITKGQFSVNFSDLSEEDENKITLKITYKQYTLEFSDLSKDHFQGHWKVIVTKPEKPSDYIPNPELVDYVYRIEFYSGDSYGRGLSRIKYNN